MHTSLIDVVIANAISAYTKTMAVLHFLKFNAALVLTGSRFFGSQDETSDYDYFVSSSEFIDNRMGRTLRELGFVREWDGCYSDDPSILMIFRYTGAIDVHIQVIHEDYYDRKVDAQAKIKDLFDAVPHLMFRISKEDMKLVWRRFMGL